MIQRLTSLDSCMEFIKDVNADPVFSDPMLVSDEQWEINLLKSVERPDKEVLGVYRDDALIGFFVFYTLLAIYFKTFWTFQWLFTFFIT